jgi:hypothetical protein
MIVASLGLYSAIPGQDHETARAEGTYESSCHSVVTGRWQIEPSGLAASSSRVIMPGLV